MYRIKTDSCVKPEDLCCCRFSSLSETMTFSDMKKIDNNLFISLTNYFCPLKKAIENINDTRNEMIAHASKIELCDTDFNTTWNKLKHCILEIASESGHKAETEKAIQDQKTKCLDQDLCFQFLFDLLTECVDIKQDIIEMRKEQEFDHQVLDAKMDKLSEENSNNHEIQDMKLTQILKTLLDLKDNKERSLEETTVNTNNVVADQPEPTHQLTDVTSNNIMRKQSEFMKNKNTEEFEIEEARLTLVYKRKQPQKREINFVTVKGETDETDSALYNVIEEGANLLFIRSLVGPIQFLSVLHFYRGYFVEQQTPVRKESTTEASCRSALKSGKERKQVDDYFKCGSCQEEFNKLSHFMKHVEQCQYRNDKNSSSFETDSEDVKVVRYELKGIDEDWVRESIATAIQKSDDITTSKTVFQFPDIGSLVLWTKMLASEVKKKESFRQNVDDFVLNFMDRCPLRTEEETTFTVHVNVMKEVKERSGDILRCGGCQETFNNVYKFCSHKLECSRENALAFDDMEVATNTVHDTLGMQSYEIEKPEPIRNVQTLPDRLSPFSPTEKRLALFPDEYTDFMSKLHSADEYEKRAGVHRKLRKEVKKRNRNKSGSSKKELDSNIATVGKIHHQECPKGSSEAEESENESFFTVDDNETGFDGTDDKTEETVGQTLDNVDKREADTATTDFSTESEISATGIKDVSSRTVDAERRETFFDKSKKKYNQTLEDDDEFHYEELIKRGLNLSRTCVRQMSTRVKRTKDNYYHDLIKDPIKLQDMCKKDPGIFKQGTLEIEASHKAKCIVSNRSNDQEIIEISGRSKCGKAFTDDEVVIEVLGKEQNKKESIRMNKMRQEKTFGKVMGILKRHRCVGMDYPVFLCEIDEHEMDKAKPICKTVPKFHLVRQEDRDTPDDRDKKQFKVDVFSYDKRTNNLIFQERLKINKNLIKACLFYVVCISWENLQYPLGAIFKKHKSTENYLSSMKILDLQFRIPSLYDEKIINDVETIQDLFTNVEVERLKKDRVDLKHLNVFTIDPENTTVFDDGISICELADGGYEVGIHIADVASVVAPGSFLDGEAFRRGTTYFPGQFSYPHQMLPEPISESICSLCEDQERLTLSVFLYFDSRKEIDFKKTKYCKTIVKSHKRLSYKQVQNMIDGIDTKNEYYKEVRLLFDISRSIRRRRLGRAMHAFPIEIALPGDRDADCREAYNLIEEFMLVTNYLVAIMLQKEFPETLPVRCQEPPPSIKIENWIKSYPFVVDLIMELQGKVPLPGRPIRLSNLERSRPNDIVAVQKKVWDDFKQSIKNHDFIKARNIICEDEVHPFHCLALNELEKIQFRAEYKCLGSISSKEEGTHFSLGLFPYVHFTAPIRRYIDIVAQRLFHSAIDKTKPYEKDEIIRICSHVNSISRKEASYRSKCKELVLAGILTDKPFMTHGFVADFSETEINIMFPGLKFLHEKNKTIKLSTLRVFSPAVTKADLDFKRQLADQHCLELRWKMRIYSVTEKPPSPRNLSRRYLKVSNDEFQPINPHQRSVFQLTTRWITYLEYLSSGASSSQISTGLKLDRMFKEESRLFYVQSAHKTENDINSELNKISFESDKEKSVILDDQFCKFSFTFSHGQVLAIQFSSEMKKGLLTPTMDLLDMTKSIKFCLKHMRDPVSCLESYCTKKSSDDYSDSEKYKETWIPILLMESAFTVVRENGIVINDIFIKFERNCGYFLLKKSFCFERSIDINVITSRFLEKSAQTSSNRSAFSTGVSDYICIKCPISYDEGDHVLGHNLHCKHYYWIGHAKIYRTLPVAKGDPNEKLRVYFKLVNDSEVPQSLRYNNSGVKCCIEILQRIESNKRMEVAIEFINRADILAKSIALNKPPPALDASYLKLVKKCDVEIGLPQNNDMQNKAIRAALTSSFCLIHGPPGTGKTNTGVKLIHLFYEINQRLRETQGEDQRYILFCGPSNKSVDLVARRFMKYNVKGGPSIVRFYGSTIEQLDSKIPGNLIVGETGLDYKPDAEIDEITVHKRIRRNGAYAMEIQKYEREFRDNIRNFSPDKEKEYRKILNTATIEELKKHDVIFCTTSMTTNARLIEAIETNVSQLIIDECGMCIEPECVSSIIATKPKQVVLIGDHKQLRPIVMCKQAADLGLEKSLFERYCKQQTYFVQLNMQYRMHESICNFPSKTFYDGTLITAESASYQENPRLSIWLNEHDLHRQERHIFCHVQGIEEINLISTELGNERSCSNPMEVDQVVKIFKHLRNVEKIFDHGCTLNIMSQYNAQIKAIKEKLEREKIPHPDIHTVVSSQGGEWDYVIFSLVRSLPDYRIEPYPTKGWCKENLGFITDANQINVALTRAKKGLFLIGNKNLLCCDSNWKDLIQEYEVKNCVVDGLHFPKASVRPNRKKKSTMKVHQVEENRKDDNAGKRE